mmetsp:Transcript_34792/g.109870  ORF Transcript_34792/g.109870 Transcript_34792/m.109870 type:complete len:235 (-) Transcript_34792:196-900(-)
MLGIKIYVFTSDAPLPLGGGGELARLLLIKVEHRPQLQQVREVRGLLQGLKRRQRVQSANLPEVKAGLEDGLAHVLVLLESHAELRHRPGDIAHPQEPERLMNVSRLADARLRHLVRLRFRLLVTIHVHRSLRSLSIQPDLDPHPKRREQPHPDSNWYEPVGLGLWGLDVGDLLHALDQVGGAPIHVGRSHDPADPPPSPPSRPRHPGGAPEGIREPTPRPGHAPGAADGHGRG